MQVGQYIDKTQSLGVLVSLSSDHHADENNEWRYPVQTCSGTLWLSHWILICFLRVWNTVTAMTHMSPKQPRVPILLENSEEVVGTVYGKALEHGGDTPADMDRTYLHT